MKGVAAAVQGMIVARKSDSQDICFVPEGDYMTVLQREGLKHSHAGNFELTDGRKIGKHLGAACYTIGQRKGLGIAWEHPLYVVGKDAGKNAIILGKNEDLFRDSLMAKDVNFLVDVPQNFSCTAKIRYKARDVACEVSLKNNLVEVQFNEPQRAITPGQSVVFYDGDVVLGGGVIV